MGPPCPQLKALSARPRGTRSCSLVLGPDTAGLQAGRVESIGVLLGRGHSLGGRTCAHAAGKGLPSPGPRLAPTLLEGVSWGPSPASLPALQAAPNLRPTPHAGHPRKPRGGLGSGESAAGAETTQQSKTEVCPKPPARTPAPPYLVPGPAFRNRSLARGWVEKCDREIVVPAVGRVWILLPVEGLLPPPGETGLHPPACARPSSGERVVWGPGGESAPGGPAPQLCDVRTAPPPPPAPPQPQFPLRPLGCCWKEGVCVQARGGAGQAPRAWGAAGDAALSRVEGRTAPPQLKRVSVSWDLPGGRHVPEISSEGHAQGGVRIPRKCSENGAFSGR